MPGRTLLSIWESKGELNLGFEERTLLARQLCGRAVTWIGGTLAYPMQQSLRSGLTINARNVAPNPRPMIAAASVAL